MQAQQKRASHSPPRLSHAVRRGHNKNGPRLGSVLQQRAQWQGLVGEHEAWSKSRRPGCHAAQHRTCSARGEPWRARPRLTHQHNAAPHPARGCVSTFHDSEEWRCVVDQACRKTNVRRQAHSYPQTRRKARGHIRPPLPPALAQSALSSHSRPSPVTLARLWGGPKDRADPETHV